jgi:hypothetical protein
MPEQHTVPITFNPGTEPVALSADGSKVEPVRKTKRLDSICWVSPHGTVTVQFTEQNPLEGGGPGDGQFRTLVKTGVFPYRCTVTTPGGSKHGWPQNQGGGGSVEVEPLP